MPLFPGGGINSSACLLQSMGRSQSSLFPPSVQRLGIGCQDYSEGLQHSCIVLFAGRATFPCNLGCRSVFSCHIQLIQKHKPLPGVCLSRWEMAGLCSGVFLLSGLLDIDKKSFAIANYSCGGSSLIFSFKSEFPT